MEDLILFGMQGAGKGTQGAILASEYGYAVFDTGSALRNIAKEESELGIKVKDIMNKGLLVPTEIVMEVMEDFVNKQGEDKNLVFDGIPRNKEQMEQFEALMEKLKRKPKALYILLTREVAENRLLKRRTCRACGTIFPWDYEGENCDKCDGELYVRSDDNETAIRKRIDVFFEQTKPIIDFYQSEDRLVEIDGYPGIAEVTRQIKQKLSLT